MSELMQEEKKKKTSGKSAASAPEQTVQRDLQDVNGPEGGMLPGDVSSRIQSKRGTGQRLSGRQLENYSQKFGRDMSDVHIHTDAESDTISRSLNARAFTIGSDVFLTKGINPDGGGRDAETMTHELTHVVQQGGHASYGPLKLGAANTSQEHEAEATAMREFSYENAERNTIQRGFWSSFGKAVGFKALNLVGLGGAFGVISDAFSEFLSGDRKVKAAIEKMKGPKRAQYDQIESRIKALEGSELKVAKDKVVRSKKSDKQVEKENSKLEKASRNKASDGAAAPASMDFNDVADVGSFFEPHEKNYARAQAKNAPETSDDLGLDSFFGANEAGTSEETYSAQQEYDALQEEYQNLLNQQVKLLKEVDETITKDDVNKYRSGKAKTFFSSMFAAIGGGILGSFESDPEKKAEARKKGMRDVNNWFASKNKQTSDIEEQSDEEKEAAKEAEAKERKQKEQTLIKDIWQDVKADEQLSAFYQNWILFKSEVAGGYSSMITDSLKEGESEAEIKNAVLISLKRKTEKKAAAASSNETSTTASGGDTVEKPTKLKMD